MIPPQRDQYGLGRRASQAGGQPIGALMLQRLAYPDLISLAAGFVDNASLPIEPARRAMEAILSDPGGPGGAAIWHDRRLRPVAEAVLDRLRSQMDPTHRGRPVG